MNLAWIRKLRRGVPIEYEYAVRRSLLRLVRVRYRSAFDQVFHCCVWKTASQWVRLILSDPRVYAYSGLAPVVFGKRYQLPSSGVQDAGRRIFSAMYFDYTEFVNLPKSKQEVAFFVLRDPRDILVSWYFSNRYSHRINPVISCRRALLSTMSDEEGLICTARDFREISHIMRSWIHGAAQDRRVKLVRYEDLTGSDQIDAWSDLLQHCDIRIPKDVLRRVLHTYSFEKMSGGRRKGVEVRNEKYRKGVAGDWKNHFSPALAEAFVAWNGDIVERAGYKLA